MGDPGVDGRIILRWIKEERDGGTDWTDLAQEMDKCQAACERGNELTKLLIPTHAHFHWLKFIKNT